MDDKPDAVKPLAQDCPFCGKGARTWEDDFGFRGASCSDAECGASELIMTIEQWNRRTPPAGWKLVPVEPTEKMIDAGLDYFKDYFSDGAYVGNEGVKYSYKTIIEAAPENDDER